MKPFLTLHVLQAPCRPQCPCPPVPPMLSNGAGCEIKVSGSPGSKASMAGWADALCKKEEKIGAPSRGLGCSGFGVSYYPASLNLHLSTRRHHGTLMGFLFNTRFFKEEKLGQEGVARTREPIAEGQRGAPQMPWICPRQSFLGFVSAFGGAW